MRVDESSLSLARLTAQAAELDAALAANAISLEKAEIRAPFDGVVASRLIDEGAVVSGGQAVARLLEDAPARFRAGLPVDLAQTLRTGDATTVRAGGQTFPATLIEVDGDLDPHTRTVAVTFAITGEAPPARSTGEIAIEVATTATGAWVPLSALRPGPEGTWTLQVIDEGGAVGIEAAEVLYAAGERAFVRGTFHDGEQFLPSGGHRVVPGDTVRLARISK